MNKSQSELVGEIMMNEREETLRMPQVAVITDLGEGNEGSIYPDAALPTDIAEQAANDIAKPEYRKQATRTWRCVDGRLPEGGLAAPEGMADPQGAGGIVIVDTATDAMTQEFSVDDRLSVKVAEKTRQAIEVDEVEVVVHGDNHTHGKVDKDGNEPETNKAGCGANVHLRAMLRLNAQRADVVLPKAVALSQAAGLGRYYTDEKGVADEDAMKDRINDMIATGARNADQESFWDATPEEVADIIVANGGVYEELIEDHAEVVAIADFAEGALDEETFMKDHVITLEDGRTITLEAFIASIGEYKKLVFERAEKLGQSEVWAADRVMGMILQTIGTLKKLTAKGFQAAAIVA